jgi:ubiquinone/menaquinone biosynthesis C-methylase UbiE
VTFLVAELVGRTGAVVGIDRNPLMLAAARERTQAAAWSNVSFVESDLDNLHLQSEFDAVVGRLVLLHLADPVEALHNVAHHLRPRGINAFQEPDLTRLGASFPALPTLERTCHWVREAHRHLGLDTQFVSAEIATAGRSRWKPWLSD